jgi:hypothetical protein
MMGHPGASTPEPRTQWESRVMLDEATNEHYSILFIDEEGAPSNFQGVREALDARCRTAQKVKTFRPTDSVIDENFFTRIRAYILQTLSFCAKTELFLFLRTTTGLNLTKCHAPVLCK